MTTWRTIITDSESLTRVAPACPHRENHTDATDTPEVLDCCPGPHIECWSETGARVIAKALTDAEAEVCS